jgi:hypothetical protein
MTVVAARLGRGYIVAVIIFWQVAMVVLQLRGATMNPATAMYKETELTSDQCMAKARILTSTEVSGSHSPKNLAMIFLWVVLVIIQPAI